MLRSLTVIAVLLLIAGPTTTQGHDHHHHHHHHGHNAGASLFGFGIGMGSPGSYPIDGLGYGYAPFQSGKFRAPSMLEDPYFRAKYKFDSRYPGRYSRQEIQRQQAIRARW